MTGGEGGGEGGVLTPEKSPACLVAGDRTGRCFRACLVVSCLKSRRRSNGHQVCLFWAAWRKTLKGKKLEETENDAAFHSQCALHT